MLTPLQYSQALGAVNKHRLTCYRPLRVESLRRRFFAQGSFRVLIDYYRKASDLWFPCWYKVEARLA